MIFYSFFAALFFSVLELSAGIVLNPFIGEDYEIDRSQTEDQVLGPLTIILDTYHHKIFQTCVRILSLRLGRGGEEFLDNFQVSCDVHTPFTLEQGIIDIEDGVDVAQVAVVEGQVLSAVVLRSQSDCVQRIYTHDGWNTLGETMENKLSEEECKQMKSKGSTRGLVPTRRKRSATVEKLPELGETKGKIISLDDMYIDHYKIEGHQVVSGDSVKVTAMKELHQGTGNCATFLHIDTKLTEDCLDYSQITCDEGAAFFVGEGMIVFGGLVYIRDKTGDSIWAVYVMEDHCILRVFTDKDQLNLVAEKDRKLTWDQCKEVITSKDIAGLPAQNEENTSPTGLSFAGWKFLTGSRKSLTSPTSSSADVLKKSNTPADTGSLLGRILSWGTSWRTDTQTSSNTQTPLNTQPRTPRSLPPQNQGTPAKQSWFPWL